MKKVFSFLAAAFTAVSLCAEPYTLTFNLFNSTSGDNSSSYSTSSAASDIFTDATHVVSIDAATKVYAGRQIEGNELGAGIKFGSSSAAGEFAFTLDAACDSFVVSAAQYGNDAVTITVNNVEFAVNGGNKQFITKTFAGATQISISAPARAYVNAITVYPGAGAPTPGAGIVYELNGGVTNEYGWMSKGEMFEAFMTDAGATAGFNTLEYYMQQADPLGAPNICSSLTNAAPALTMEKWAWLKAYIEAAHADQAADGASALLADGTGAAWRYAVGAFFVSGQRTGWPKSANFAALGQDAAYIPAWQHAYANPTEPTETFVLNEPYKANSTFDGWYASADFSGEKVLSVDATTTGTLYAKWVEYIPTIAEVKALADDTNTKVSGVVTFINGKNVYVQDATGGMLLYMKANPTFAVGQKVTVSGTKTMYGGAPEVKNGEEVAAEEGVMPAAVAFETFNAACKDANLFTRVSFMGLRITSLDSYGNPYVTDGIDTLQCYRMVPDTTVYTVGKKVNVTAILGYYNKYQLVGDAATAFELVRIGAHDNYNYPARGANGEYTLENKWVISTVEDNYAANKPGSNDFVRGMAAKDGIMYFINRETQSLVRVDANDANMLDPIRITGEHLFEVASTNEAGDTTYAAAVTLAFNDIKFDGAGHALIGACVSGGQHFMIYKVDVTTGAATLLVDEALVDNDDFATITDNGGRTWSGRFDAFGVYGDVDNDAVIMAADANSFYAYKWEIVNGVAQAATRIDCAPDPSSDESLLIGADGLTVTSFGTAPQIFPVDENYFYVDGWSTLPMLFDMDGILAEDFISCPTGVAIANNEGDTCKMNMGHNGLCEFQIGDEYFMVMAATNTVGSPTSAFALYKFADAAKSFSGIEPLWYFPANGMGALTNGCRTAVPSVEVNGNKATIYLYTNNNGYAVYEFTGKEAAEPVAVENMWIIGNCATAEWNPAASKQMTKTADGVFEVVETLTGTWFAFTSSNSDNWDEVNAHRFGSNPSGENISDGAAHAITGINGDYCFTVSEAGTYKFVVDLNAMTVTCTPVSALENTEAASINKVVENGQVYIIKNGVRYSVLGSVVK